MIIDNVYNIDVNDDYTAVMLIDKDGDMISLLIKNDVVDYIVEQYTSGDE